MLELTATVEESVLSLGASPWLLLAVVVLATIDGVFPPVPSESVVIAVAVLSLSGGGPNLWLLVLAAAVGAFCGDVLAYTIGSKIPVDRWLRSRRGRAMLGRARRALAQRGTVYILSARFVPVGRVAVNMTAGAAGYPRLRFLAVAGVAAVVWGSYSTALGMGAGVVLHDNPLLAITVGVAGGVVAGLVVDKVLTAVHARWFPAAPTPAQVLLDGTTGADPAERSRR